LSPLEQMRVACYRGAYREAFPGVVENLHARIAPKVQKIGGGSPTRNAIRQLLEQVDADPAWYPGKAAVLAHAGKRSGPEPALSGAKKRCIANSAMAAKEEGLEPTYPLAVARCPKAVLNPATNEPVDKKIVYSIFKTMCYDKDPTQKWKNQARAARGALTLAMMAHRLAWGRQMLALGHAAGYFSDTTSGWTSAAPSSRAHRRRRRPRRWPGRGRRGGSATTRRASPATCRAGRRA